MNKSQSTGRVQAFLRRMNFDFNNVPNRMKVQWDIL